MLDHPHIGGTTGGEASAPIFKQIAAKIFVISGRFPKAAPAVMAAGDSRLVPDVVSLTTGAAREILESRGFAVVLTGASGVVRGQLPRAGATSKKGATVTLMASEVPCAPSGYTLVPDLRGMPLRRAINTLAVQQLGVSITGSGVVLSQQPAAGQQVKIGTRVAIHCESRSPVLLSLN